MPHASASRCIVHSLTTSTQYNNMQGVVTGEIGTDRFKVMLDGNPDEKSFHYKNLNFLWTAVPTADELKRMCTITVIVELPMFYDSHMLELDLGGSDRNAMRSLIASISPNTHYQRHIFTKNIAETDYYIRGIAATRDPSKSDTYDQRVVLLKYNPESKSGVVCCLRNGCHNPLPTHTCAVLCGGCMLPRFCNDACAELDVEHARICGQPVPVSAKEKAWFIQEHDFIAVKKNVDKLAAETLGSLGAVERQKIKSLLSVCACCGVQITSVRHACGVCKSEFYCSDICQNNRIDKHECVPVRFLMAKVSLPPILYYSKPEPHDEGGKLMAISVKSMLLHNDIVNATDDKAIQRMITEMYAARDTEVAGWESLGDYLEVANAHFTSAIIAAENEDCFKAIDLLQKSQLALRSAPPIFMRRYITRIDSFKLMLDAVLNCMYSVVRLEAIRRIAEPCD